MSEPRKGIIPPQVAVSRVNASLAGRRADEDDSVSMAVLL